MSALTSYEEKALVSRLAAGEGAAFTALFTHYQNPLSHYIIKYVKSPQLAEDLTQEVFLKIWEQRIKLHEIQSFRAFLFVVARNHTLNTLHTASRSQAAMGEISHHALAQRNPTEDAVLTREYQQFLQRTIESLPPRAREVFRLCREQQLSYEEVAAKLGISRNSVKNHMVHSMKILKASVETELGIPLSLFLIILHGS